MKTTIDLAMDLLEKKIKNNFAGSVKIHISDEGSIIIDESGIRKSNEPARCTMTATAKTFKALLMGNTKVQVAIMSKKLEIKGDIKFAIELGKHFS